MSQEISKTKRLWKERRGHGEGCELRSWTFSVDHRQNDYLFLYFLLFCITDTMESEAFWKVLKEVLFSSMRWPEDFNLYLQKLVSLDFVLFPGRFSLTTAVTSQTIVEKYDEWKEYRAKTNKQQQKRQHHSPLFILAVIFFLKKKKKTELLYANVYMDFLKSKFSIISWSFQEFFYSLKILRALVEQLDKGDQKKNLWGSWLHFYVSKSFLQECLARPFVLG